MGTGSRKEEEEEEEVDQVEEEEEEEELNDKEIVEEYKIWKKNTPFLYDLVITHVTTWPSLTVQWLEKTARYDDKNYSDHELLLGSQTSGGEQNHLTIARVRLPNEDTEIDARNYDDEKGELGSYGGTGSKIEVKVRINHDGDINLARYMPQDDYVIATKTVTGEVHVFFIREHESTPAKDGISCPNIRCVGHSQEGYGLDWSKTQRGHIISSADDSTICHWDTQASNAGPKGLEPLNKITAHGGVIGDVSFHCQQENIFGSVGDDSYLNIWDLRDVAKPKFSVKAHSKEAQTLSFSPFSDFLLLTGSADELVRMWDMRKIDKPLHTFHGHHGEIYRVQWSPFSEAVFASCGSDRRVHVWDSSRIGQEQTSEEAEDGPPELLFMHGGHCSKVTDFSWNKNDPWVIASVDEENVLQVWQMAENIYADELETDQKVDDNDLE